jgi:tetratricopeptide (TPR) repeat protein
MITTYLIELEGPSASVDLTKARDVLRDAGVRFGVSPVEELEGEAVRYRFEAEADPDALEELLNYCRILATLGLRWRVANAAGEEVASEEADRARLAGEMGECPMGGQVGGDAAAREWLVRARALKERGDFGGAMTAYTQTLKNAPDMREAYYERGECFHELGCDQEAVEDLKEAARLGYGPAHKDLDLNRFRPKPPGEEARVCAVSRMIIDPEAERPALSGSAMRPSVRSEEASPASGGVRFVHEESGDAEQVADEARALRQAAMDLIDAAQAMQRAAAHQSQARAAAGEAEGASQEPGEPLLEKVSAQLTLTNVLLFLITVMLALFAWRADWLRVWLVGG